MANIPLLLTRKKRIVRRDLLLFLNGINLSIFGGVEMKSAWNDVLDSLMPQLSRESVELLRINTDLSFSEGLRNLGARSYWQIWFHSLSDLYEAGSPVGEGLGSFVHFLLSEEKLDLEEHCRTLPTKINVALILFFLPATFVVLFLPLLMEFGSY